MAIRKIKPNTPGQRFMTVSTYEEITCTTPERSLMESLKSNAGRNNKGRLPPSAIAAAAQSVSIVLLTSNATRTTSPQRLQPLNTIPTVPQTSLFCTMQTAKSVTSLLLTALRSAKPSFPAKQATSKSAMRFLSKTSPSAR